MTELSAAAQAFLDQQSGKPQLSPSAQAFLKMRQQQIKAVQEVAPKFDPDQFADALQKSRETGLPLDAVHADPAAAQELLRRGQMNLQRLQGTPVLSGLVKNLEFAAVAQDDLDNLSGFEKFWAEKFGNPAERGLRNLQSGTSIAGATQAAKKLDLLDELEELEQTDRAAVLRRLGEIGDPDPRFNEYFRTSDPEARAAIRENYERAATGLVKGAAEANQLARAIPRNPELVNALQGDWKDMLGAVLRSPGIIVELGVESTVQTLPGLLAAPMTGGASLGMNSMLVEYGSKIGEILQEQGVDTTDPQAILAALKDPERRQELDSRAKAKAVPVALFDTLSIGLAGVKLVPSTMAGLKSHLANMGAQIGVQGAAGAAGEATGQLAADGEINSAEVMLEALAESFSAIPDTATMAGGKLVGEVMRYREAKQTAAILDEAMRQADLSKTAKRDPKSYADFVNQATDATAYIDAKEFAGFFQSMKIDPQDAAEEMGVLKRYVEAMQNGGDVPIKLGDLLAKVAGKQEWKAIMQHVRLKPDAMSSVEALNWAQDRAAQMQQEADKILGEVDDRVAFEESADRVRDSIAAQLESTGMTAQTARYNAELHRAFAISMASRLGIMPEHVYLRFGLNVVGNNSKGFIVSLSQDQIIDRVAGMDPVDLDVPQDWRGINEEGRDSYGSPGAQERPLGETPITDLSNSIRRKLADVKPADGESLNQLAIQDTIEVDGTQRPTVNSEGRPIHPTEEGVRNFWRWFGDSKVVDAQGRPLVVYHGTNADFNEFKVKFQNAGQYGGKGFFFTGKADSAGLFGDKIMPVYLKAEVGLKEKSKARRAGTQVEVDHIRPADDPRDIWIVFSPTQIKSATGNAGTFRGDDANILNQGAQRGAIDLANFPQATIALFENADLSTFLHETGHFFFEVMAHLAHESPEIRADVDTLLKFTGFNGTAEQWLAQDINTRRAAHELVAEAFEKYLFEGKAPTPQLQGLFNRFRTWLVQVYKSLTNMRVKLTDDVRLVFDRMLATQEAIDAAGRSMPDDTLFESAEQAGMTAGEFSDYKRAAEQSKQDAINRGLAKAMADIKRMINADRAAIKKRIEREVYNEPANAAWYFLRRGKPFHGKLPEGLQPVKLSKAALVDMYGEDIPDLPNVGQYSVYTTGDDGIHPDLLAPFFGYTTGDELVQAVSNADPKAEVSRRVTEELHKLYGDLDQPGAIEALAQEIAHEKISIETLFEENRRLSRQVGVMPMDKQALQAYAERQIAGKRVRDIQPHVFAQAAARAGKKAEAALRSANARYRDQKERQPNSQASSIRFRSNVEEAAYWKRVQIINELLYREANKAKQQAEKIVRYLKGFERKATRERIGKAGARGGDYLGQIDGILDQYDLKQLSAPERDKLQSLAAFVDSLDPEDQALINIDPAVLDRARRTNWKDITLEELQGVNDAVKNIAKAASIQGRLLASEYAQNLEQARQDLTDSIISNASKTIKKEIEKRLPSDALMKIWHGFLYMHRRLSSLVHQMDGGKDRGVMWNLLMRPLNQAGDNELSMLMDYNKQLADVFNRHYSSNELRSMTRKRKFVGVDKPFTKQGVLVMALNSGTQDNRTKMLAGLADQGVTEGDVTTLLDTLDQRDWQFVQDVWAMINSLWPQIEAKQKRVYGVAPEKVEGMPVNTRFGTIDGAYFPLKYDDYRAEEHSVQDMAKQMMQGAFSASTTRRGHTKERVSNVRRLIRLDFGVINQHLTEVIHDLTHHEVLIDTTRLMKSRAVQDAIINRYGDGAYKYILESLKDIAAGDTPARNEFESVMQHLRNGTTVVGMGWSISTALLQPLGLTNSIVRIGARWVGVGLRKFYGSPSDMQRNLDAIRQQSKFMAERMNAQNREIADVRGKLKGKRLTAIEETYFWLITRMQMLVDAPTWIGAYHKALDQNATEAEAIAFADQAVIDAQGAGTVKDLAAIQRGGPLMKLFTNFASYFITTWNLMAQRTGNRKKGTVGMAQVAADFVLLYTIPAMMGFLLNAALKGMSDDDEEELMKTLAREQLLFFAGSFIGARDAAAALLSQFGYSGPSGTRFFTELEKVSTQASQGEADMAAAKAVANTAGILFHLPTGQVMRTIEGTVSVMEGESDIRAIAFGPQRD